jgi:hypothetical protein
MIATIGAIKAPINQPRAFAFRHPVREPGLIPTINNNTDRNSKDAVDHM